ASVVVTLLLGGGAWLWLREERAARDAELARRRADIERDVTAMLHEADTLRQQGRKMTEDLDRWGATLALAEGAARRTAELLGECEGLEHLRDRLQRLSAELAEDDRDRQMLDRLYAIQLQIADDWEWEKAAGRYAEAFRAYGIDVLALDPDEAGRRIGQRAI